MEGSGKKRRVCVVAASELTIRAFLAQQLRAMQEQYDLTVVVNTANANLLGELAIAGTLRPVAIERQVSLWSDLRALAQLSVVMRAGRFDLVHSFTPKAGLLAMIAARLARVPVRLHTFTGQVWATRTGVSRHLLKLLDRVLVLCATCTLTDSASQRDFLIAEGVVASPDQVMVLGNGSVSGVDTERFRPDPAIRRRFRESLGIPSAGVLLLFIGRLHRDKGVLDLARAFALLAAEREDVYLLVAGPDEHDLRHTISRIAGPHADRVRFLDFTSAPEHAMAASDVLCLPSYREGFGSVIIEAASTGVPAVASRIYGIVDAVEAGATGLLHRPGEIGDLLSQLRLITGDAPLRTLLGVRARVRARRDFCHHDVTAAVLDLYAMLLRTRRQSWYARSGKRAFDLALAGVALVLLLPIAGVLAAVIRLCFGSPVLFRQQRPGLHGAPFELIKFRTMVDRRDASGGLLSDGDRLTTLGRALRAASLDEIPELWNVIRGDMSLVGPRPLLMRYLPRYTPTQARRHDVRPGITGLAQVGGRNSLSWERKFELDLQYIDDVSLRLDLEILAATLVQVLSRRGITQTGQATAEEFMGSPTEAASDC
jgi:lipopolysaccharide/colanic/teichoic acid biosynthesis glycosyltransferase